MDQLVLLAGLVSAPKDFRVALIEIIRITD